MEKSSGGDVVEEYKGSYRHGGRPAGEAELNTSLRGKI
jgi:hypothetical protein